MKFTKKLLLSSLLLLILLGMIVLISTELIYAVDGCRKEVFNFHHHINHEEYENVAHFDENKYHSCINFNLDDNYNVSDDDVLVVLNGNFSQNNSLSHKKILMKSSFGEKSENFSIKSIKHEFHSHDERENGFEYMIKKFLNFFEGFN